MTLCSLLTIFCISGPAVAIDGDTIKVRDTIRGEVAVRLWGIDAPELDEQFGKASHFLLSRLIEGKRVVCESQGKSHKRIVATCTIDGRDLGEAQVRGGGALDCRFYSFGRYAQLENPAAREHIRRKIYCGAPR